MTTRTFSISDDDAFLQFKDMCGHRGMSKHITEFIQNFVQKGKSPELDLKMMENELRKQKLEMARKSAQIASIENEYNKRKSIIEKQEEKERSFESQKMQWVERQLARCSKEDERHDNNFRIDSELEANSLGLELKDYFSKKYEAEVSVNGN